MTAWTPQGSIGLLSPAVFWKYMPEPAKPMLLWGDPEYARTLLRDAFDLRCEELVTTLRAPSAEAVWDLWSRSQPTAAGLVKRLDEARRQAFRADFIAFHERYSQGGEIVMPREYCLYTGTRR